MCINIVTCILLQLKQDTKNENHKTNKIVDGVVKTRWTESVIFVVEEYKQITLEEVRISLKI